MAWAVVYYQVEGVREIPVFPIIAAVSRLFYALKSPNYSFLYRQ